MKDISNIKNLIFDLGNVLLDVNPELTIQAFNELGMEQHEAKYSFETSNNLFLNFEIGDISEKEFRKQLKRFGNKKISDQEFDHAWNAMLLTIPENRLNLLLELRKTFDLYLLSNTNSIHYRDYNSTYPGLFHSKNSSIFKKLYFSHEIHMRKPNAEIFRYVLTDAGIIASETLFIDDLRVNLQAAAKFGIKTLQPTDKNDIVSLFTI